MLSPLSISVGDDSTLLKGVMSVVPVLFENSIAMKSCSRVSLLERSGIGPSDDHRKAVDFHLS